MPNVKAILTIMKIKAHNVPANKMKCVLSLVLLLLLVILPTYSLAVAL